MNISFRSFLATALAASLSAGAVHAQTALNQSVYSPSQPVTRTTLVRPAVPFKAQTAGKGAGIQALDRVTVDSLQNAFSYYSSGIQPLRYEPISGQLVTIRRGALTTEEDAVNNLDNIFIHRSNNLGVTWEAPIGPVDANDDPGASRYPSVYPFQRQGETIYAYTFPYISTSGGNQSFGSLGYGLVTESSPEPFVITHNGFSYQGTQFTWGTGTHLLTTQDNNKLVVMGNPTPAEGAPNTMSNIVAVQVIDINTFEMDPIVSSSWSPDKFPDPGQPGFVTVTVTGIDRDAAGALHIGFFGRFNDNPDGPDARTFGISSSYDNGQTWSAIKFLPASVVASYVNSRGVSNPDSAGLSFTTDKVFAVTGSGNAHFITNVLDFRVNATDEERFADLVEISLENNNWSIRKIADRPLTDRSAFPLELMANDNNIDSLTQSQMMSELQLAKTADGNYLVAKWINYRNNGEGLIFDENLFPYGDGVAPDTMITTDIFISARRTGTGQWTAQPINLTDDIYLDRITWIPDILPNDLTNIPLLQVQAEQLPSETTEGRILFGQHNVVSRKQYVQISHFNASLAVGVEDQPTGTAAVYLDNAYPNPALGTTSIGFTLPAAGAATLEVHNAMGQKIATLFDGMASQGGTRVTFDTRDLAAGIYYYSLRWNGGTETRMLTVVR